MAVKAHKRDNGQWAPCKATVNPCPLSASEHTNFANYEEMRAANQEITDTEGRKKHGMLGQLNNPGFKINLPKFEVHSMFDAFAM